MTRYCSQCIYCNIYSSEAERELGIEHYECGLFMKSIPWNNDEECEYFEQNWDKY